MASVSRTPNAVRKMIMGEPMVPEEDPWIVMILLHPKQPKKKTTKKMKMTTATPNGGVTDESSSSSPYLTVTIWDCSDSAQAVVIGPLTQTIRTHVNSNSNNCNSNTNRSLIVAVYAYICSEANCKDQEPFLCIIPVAIQESSSSSPHVPSGRVPLQLPPGKKIKGGIAPVFFAGMAHLLSNQALSGLYYCHNNSNFLSSSANHAKIVADHLAKQSAMATLARASAAAAASASSSTIIIDVDNPTNNNHSNGNSTTSSSSTTEEPNNTKYYMSALREFQTSQLDRQNSSLTTNAGREDATRAALIVRQHDLALQQALRDHAAHAPLSTALLCQWHAILCGNGVLASTTTNNSTNVPSDGGAAATAGVIRTKNVRVGNVHFRPHHVVRGDVDSLCQSINSLEQRLLHQSSIGRPVAAALYHQSRAGVEAATFAACVLFGVLDVHAFCDGNGRLARIALNWALHKAGIPFVIHLFATPAQRKEYVDATVKTRRNLSLIGQGRPQYYSQEDLVHAHEASGALGPLVDLILDRLAKTIIEFEKIVQEKSRLVSEEVQARAAKAVRDRERSGSCLICFDDNPNIGTLCCGKAVHLNCIAQWLSQNNTCPNCREQFPAIPPRMIAPPAAPPAAPALAARLRGTGFSESDVGLFDTDEEEDADDADMDATTLSDADDDDGDTTEHMDDELNRQIAAAIVQHQQAVQQAAAAQVPQQNDTTTEDDSTEEYDTTTVAVAAAAANNHNDNFDTESTTDNTTTVVAAPLRNEYNGHLPPFCVMADCSNRAARDCSNSTCGRCCMSYGRYSCARHNN